MQKGEPAYCLGKVELDKRLDITLTRDLLGYAPQDDAFNIFGDHLREWLQDESQPAAPAGRGGPLLLGA